MRRMIEVKEFKDGTVVINDGLSINKNGDVTVGKNLEVDGNIETNGIILGVAHPTEGWFISDQYTADDAELAEMENISKYAYVEIPGYGIVPITQRMNDENSVNVTATFVDYTENFEIDAGLYWSVNILKNNKFCTVKYYEM